MKIIVKYFILDKSLITFSIFGFSLHKNINNKLYILLLDITSLVLNQNLHFIILIILLLRLIINIVIIFLMINNT